MLSRNSSTSRLRNKYKLRNKSKGVIRKETRTRTESLCYQSQKELIDHIPLTILSKYKKSISSSINKLIHNHKNKIQNCINISKYIKTESDYTKTCQHIPLSTSSEFNIPPFIDIFKFLFTNSTFTKHFTPDELNEASKILSLQSDDTITLNTQPKPDTSHQIYTYLANHPLGNKITDIYSRYSHNINLVRHFPTMDFHELLFNRFTSYSILEAIQKQTNTVTKCTITWKGHTFPNFLYIFHNTKHNTKHNKKHNTKHKSKFTNTTTHERSYHSREGEVMLDELIVKLIVERILFINELLKTNKLPTRLIIFLIDNKKEIDNEVEMNAHFRTVNINTAVTNMQDIIIYREEELLKSIFHEFIHFHNLDYKTLPSNIHHKLNQYLETSHNLSNNNQYLIYESITESLTNVLNSLFISKTIREFKENMINEILFSTYQVVKILSLCKYNKWEEFVLLDGHQTNPSKQFKQDSCVFSYYVLKLYILLNLDEYWTTVLDHEFRFNPTPDNFDKLIHIFNKGRDNIFLKNIINAMLESKSKLKFQIHSRSSNELKGNKLKSNKIRKITKTLRMTCTDS